MKTIVALVAGLFLMSCSPSDRSQTRLGKLDFVVTGNPEAVKLFHEGLLLLHSFEYPDAAEVFRQAQQADSTCAMAFWGEAMTHHHALWNEQDLAKGREALGKLAATGPQREARAGTSLEKGFMRGVNILFGEGEKPAREKAFSAHMQNLYERYRGNHEVAAFYALSLMGMHLLDRDVNAYEKSARLASAILAENPEHPGALHYLIHADDDPDHAAQALQAARDYSKVAPDAGHALHMPSHIFVAMGMWDDVVSSNEVSWQASVRRKARKKLNNDALNYHGLHWLMYGYLQQGRVQDAERLLTDMHRYCGELPSRRARTHELLLKSTYLAETDNWRHPLMAQRVHDADLSISVRALQSYVIGTVAAHEHNGHRLDSIRSALNNLVEKVRLTIDGSGFAMCAPSSSAGNDTRLDVDWARVIERQLKATVAMISNDQQGAEEAWASAEQLEASITYAYGPPAIPKPSAEGYADWLLAQERYPEAAKLYEAVLKRAPKRTLSLQGLSQAYHLAGDERRSQEIQQQLDVNGAASSAGDLDRAR